MAVLLLHRFLPALAVLASCMLAGSLAHGQEPDHSMATGTTSKAQRAAAAARIPYEQIDRGRGREIAEVVRDASIYRQLPITTIHTDPDLYLTLLRYPEIIVSTWQLMGVTKMTARRVGAFELDCSDGAGTTTRAELVYGDPHLNIYLAEGEYDGPMLLRKVTGKCVIIAESKYEADANGEPMATTRMHIFLQIDNMAANLIARSIHPLVGTTADHNFVETLKFVESLNRTTAGNGPGVQRMAENLVGLQADVRRRFQDVAGLVWQRSAQRSSVQISDAPMTNAMQTGFTISSPGTRAK